MKTRKTNLLTVRKSILLCVEERGLKKIIDFIALTIVML